MLNRFFKVAERGTNLQTELLGGVTTFVAMAYIVVVNPAILSYAGFPIGPSTIATILTAVFGCLTMGLYANLPIAVAPYMGENAFIAFGLTALGISWQQRLGAVFISGIAFLLLSLWRVRPWLANSISQSMKFSFGVGIGFFLAFIGLYETGIITSGAQGMSPFSLVAPGTTVLRAPDVPLKIGNIADPHVLLAIFGFVLTMTLLYRNVRGAILIGIILTAVLGYCVGLGEQPLKFMSLPFQGQYTLGPIFLKLDVLGVLKLSFLPILLTLFLMSFLDTLGTLVGVGSQAHMLDEKGNFPDIERPMIVDSVSCIVSSLVGSSTSGAFIESAAGIEAGARTGICAIVVALLFASSLFFLPAIEPLQHLRYAYAPALMAVGLLMTRGITKINFAEMTESVPAIVTISMMVFTYNIANGLTAGLVFYVLFKILCGKAKELNSGSIFLALMCSIYYIFGLPH